MKKGAAAGEGGGTAWNIGRRRGKVFRDLFYQSLKFGDLPVPVLCVYFLLYVSQFRLVKFRYWLHRVFSLSFLVSSPTVVFIESGLEPLRAKEPVAFSPKGHNDSFDIP